MQYSSIATSETSFIELPDKKRQCGTNLIPIVFLTLFSWSLTYTVVQDQLVYQVCAFELGFDRNDCLALSYKNNTNSSHLEEQVQPFAANLLMVKNVCEALLSIVFTLFIGPWSDKYGRKPILVSSSIGYLLTYVSYMILNLVDVQLSAWLYVVAFSFVAIVGGHVTLFVAIYCYVTDTSTEESRSTNLVILEAVLSAGVVIGSICSSYIYAWYGAAVVMGIAIIATSFVVLWCIFVLQESRVNHYTLKQKFRGIFHTIHIRDLIKVCFKKRFGIDRGVLWTIMLALGFTIFVLEGVACIIFLFVRERFQWDVRAYTLYSAFATICLILGNLFSMYCLKPITKLSDESLAVLAFISACVSSVIVAFASESWHMYLAVGFSSMMGIAKPMCRSILATISKRSDNNINEIGKIFSITASLEAMLPVVSVPLYGMVYKATLTTFPGLFNLISVAIWAACAVSLAIAFKCQKIYLQRAMYEQIDS